MDKKTRSKDKCAIPYITEDMMPEKEPDYKDLYFSLLRDVYRLKDCIDEVTGKSIQKMNKNMRVFELSEEEMDIYKKR